MRATTHNDKVLFENIRTGGEPAFALVFHAYNAHLFPFICKITKSELVAEEIVQEVFLRLWVNREDVSGMENPVGWLYRVASNLSLSYLRQLARQPQPLETAGEVPDAVTDALGARELARLIEQAISKLPPRRQEIFRLSRVQGLSHKEIAAKLALSQHTVKDQLVISLRFIKNFIHRETGISLPVLVLIAAMGKNF